MASFTTSGTGDQEIDLRGTPQKLVFEPPGTIVERGSVPAELEIRGRKLTVVRFTDKGFVVNDHGTRGIAAVVYVVEGRPTIPKQPKNAEPPIPEKGKADIHLEQHGGPNAATFGDNSPITLNATPIAPPERTLSREKFERLVTELSDLSGSTVSITVVPEDDETAAFGKQVRAAFQLARWNVSGGISGQISQTIVDETGGTHFEGEGFNCDADTNAPELAKALKAFEAVGLKCTVRSKGFLPNEGRAALAIVVGKRNR